MTFFSWIKSRSFSGKLQAQKTDGKPWNPETNLRKDYNPVAFSVELKPEEEGLTLNELIAKYPAPEEKKL